MKKQNLYLETSVFGFCFDEDFHNREKRACTETLFRQVSQGLFEGFASDVVLRELQETSDPELRAALKNLVEPLHILPARQEEDVNYLCSLYIENGAVPAEMFDDALHVALVVTNPDIDVLVSWNCRHIVNTNVKMKLRGLTEKAGYKFGFEIATPAEVIFYEV